MTSGSYDGGTSNFLSAGVSQIINFYWTQTHATGGVRRLIGLFISLCSTLLSLLGHECLRGRTSLVERSAFEPFNERLRRGSQLRELIR